MQIVTETASTPLSKATIAIQGMTCASCVKAIENALQALPSVQPGSVAVNLLLGSATLLASPELCPPSLLTQTVENSGYDVTSCKYADAPVLKPTPQSHQRSNLYRASLSISGMFCASCSSKVESLLKSLHRVIPTSVKVSLATGHAQFEYQLQSDEPANVVTNNSIADKIRELGFEADHIKIEMITDDDQTVLQSEDDSAAPTMTTTRLDISGMTCASCVSAIECKSCVPLPCYHDPHTIL